MNIESIYSPYHSNKFFNHLRNLVPPKQEHTTSQNTIKLYPSDPERTSSFALSEENHILLCKKKAAQLNLVLCVAVHKPTSLAHILTALLLLISDVAGGRETRWVTDILLCWTCLTYQFVLIARGRGLKYFNKRLMQDFSTWAEAMLCSFAHSPVWT